MVAEVRWGTKVRKIRVFNRYALYSHGVSNEQTDIKNVTECFRNHNPTYV
jgi:hypothetical protein